MIKNLLCVVCLSLPLAAFAAEGKAAQQKGAKPGKTAASAPAPVSPKEARAAVRSSKERGSSMASCRQKANDKGLNGVAAKQSISACLRGLPQ
jgi:hypothetical protein